MTARRLSRPTNPTGSQREISLLFDVFVVNQRLRTLLSTALAGTGLRSDEYAVYSLLFDAGPMTPTEMARQMGVPLTTVLDYIRSMRERGHVARRRDASDGRAFEAHLTAAGLRAFHRAHAAWNEALLDFEPALGMPVRDVRRALHAIDDAAARTLRGLVQRSIDRAG
jgi:DNA-binding MarR family transcriptional regulator